MSSVLLHWSTSYSSLFGWLCACSQSFWHGDSEIGHVHYYQEREADQQRHGLGFTPQLLSCSVDSTESFSTQSVVCLSVFLKSLHYCLWQYRGTMGRNGCDRRDYFIIFIHSSVELSALLLCLSEMQSFYRGMSTNSKVKGWDFKGIPLGTLILIITTGPLLSLSPAHCQSWKQRRHVGVASWYLWIPRTTSPIIFNTADTTSLAVVS